MATAARTSDNEVMRKTWVSVPLISVAINDKDNVEFVKGSKKNLEAATREFIEEWLRKNGAPFTVEVAPSPCPSVRLSPEVEDSSSSIKAIEASRYFDLRSAYMYIFDEFAVFTSDVMSHMGKSRGDTLDVLHKLERVGLIGGESNDNNGRYVSNQKQVPGKEKMWQCNETYDSLSREAAIEKFDAAVAAALLPFNHDCL